MGGTCECTPGTYICLWVFAARIYNVLQCPPCEFVDMLGTRAMDGIAGCTYATHHRALFSSAAVYGVYGGACTVGALSSSGMSDMRFLTSWLANLWVRGDGWGSWGWVGIGMHAHATHAACRLQACYMHSMYTCHTCQIPHTDMPQTT